MEQRDPSPSPGDRARRFSLFGSRPGSVTPPPATAGLPPSTAERVEAVMSAYQQTIQQQLDDGLRAIQSAANTLMHEIASEVWRTAGGDKQDVASSILQELSRDQAIRSMIAHSDERFQALATRAVRLEDNMNALAEGVRAAREQIAVATDALVDIQGSPTGTSQIRAELSEVTQQVASAFGALAERDHAIVEAVNLRIREHGELIAQETARISQAMESYVQHGVQAMGQLAGSTDTQVQSIAGRDEEISARLSATIDERMGALGEQLQLLHDRMGSATTALHEEMTFLSDRIGVDARESTEAIGRMVDARTRGLAQLLRSDSERLRGELVRTAEAHDERFTRLLDERLAAGLATDISDRVGEGVSRTIHGRMDETTARLETRSEELVRLIDTRMGEAVTAIDRNVVRLTDSMHGQFERNAAQIAELGQGLEDRELGQGRELAQAMDSRIASLAKLVRSDNEMLAEQIVADQEASKQVLRQVKELQASLPSDVVGTVEERFSSLAESIERSNEMLAARIDRVAEKLGQQQNDEIQVVIDRMGDAMHALASLGKPKQSTRMPEARIELE